MLRGIYAAASAMIAETARQDTISNNLANASTPGFKRDLTRFESFPQVLLSASDRSTGPIGAMSLGSFPMGTHVDMSRGLLNTTGNPMDVSIKGEGFFVVETPEGRAYTREGAFVKGDSNYLSTAKGHPVMGQSGRISLTSGAVSIDPDGTVRVGNESAGRLEVVTFAEAATLHKDGNGYFLSDSYTPQPVSSPELESGMLESSNVNPVKEMVSLITVLRSYEASVKSLTAQDDTLAKAVNEIAR